MPTRVQRGMTRTTRLFLAAAGLFVAIACGGGSEANAVVAAPFEQLPPNARHLCSEHVTGTTMHIEWSSYALRETPTDARAFYERLGLRFTVSEGVATYAPNESLRLMIYAANASYPSCSARPNANEHSVVIRSNATR